MKFTGINLERVREGISLALTELKTQIGMCDNVTVYSRELAELHNEVGHYKQLLNEIDRALEAEKRGSEIAGKALTPNQYLGKICPAHPELEGLRAKPSYRCVKCVATYASNFRKRQRAAEKELYNDP